jgi:hypothetical protein
MPLQPDVDRDSERGGSSLSLDGCDGGCFVDGVG